VRLNHCDCAFDYAFASILFFDMPWSERSWKTPMYDSECIDRRSQSPDAGDSERGAAQRNALAQVEGHQLAEGSQAGDRRSPQMALAATKSSQNVAGVGAGAQGGRRDSRWRSCGGGEKCWHVPYARGAVDVAVRELPSARARNVVSGPEVRVARGWGELL
jgi:hypothetical protein